MNRLGLERRVQIARCLVEGNSIRVTVRMTGASRLPNRVQLTTDGHKVYLKAVEAAFGKAIDYGMLVKLYGNDYSKERMYSPAVCLSDEKSKINGRPRKRNISTSFVERQNHGTAIALHFMYYNYCRPHQTLKMTPAAAAGVTDHVWKIEEIVGLLEAN